jgi:hypothetical protein
VADPAQALNETLPRCRASIQHVLENDHICLSGWDAYVLDCFDRLPELWAARDDRGRTGVSRSPLQGRGRGRAVERPHFVLVPTRDHGTGSSLQERCSGGPFRTTPVSPPTYVAGYSSPGPIGGSRSTWATPPPNEEGSVAGEDL